MSKVPSLPYSQIIRALQKKGWIVVRQRGSHIRIQKYVGEAVFKITIPAHRPVKRSTWAHILKQAKIELDQFLELL